MAGTVDLRFPFSGVPKGEAGDGRPERLVAGEGLTPWAHAMHVLWWRRQLPFAAFLVSGAACQPAEQPSSRKAVAATRCAASRQFRSKVQRTAALPQPMPALP